LVSDAQTQAERIRDDIDDLLEEIRHQAEQEESSEAP
jgi:predicted ATP-grasp superfamily ATP-dependent carboligase